MSLSITAIIAAAMFPLYFALRKDTTSPPVPLSIAVVVAAVLELFDLLALYNPEQLYFWKKYSLTAEAVLIPAWFWFALTYARQNGYRTISMPLRLMLAASSFFTIFASSSSVIPVSFIIY
jgi:hypothetical protein